MLLTRLSDTLTGILAVLGALTSAQRTRDLVEWARRDCSGDSTVCTSVSDGDCCVAGLTNAHSGRCKDCHDHDTYIIYSGGKCRKQERTTTGDTCVNVAQQSGHRWTSAGTDTDGVFDCKMAPCTNTVEPDLISIGGKWFTVNESITESDKEALWDLWGKGVPVPRYLMKYETSAAHDTADNR
ncbi:hypothetical protein BJX61DRAFT_544598 [Aspergillus egyptiacus]|nr:hypothetical protein BJX61DRAFT_544598 [Aspergillus egyptiacus]